MRKAVNVLSEIRMTFEKRGRAVFLSHLDLMHVLQRSFSRAGVRCVYSGGFNPHMQLTLPLPLPLGHEGQNEILEAFLEEDLPASGLPGLINPFLPDGILINEACLPLRKLSEMAFADYLVSFDKTTVPLDEMASYLSSESVVVLKRTKRGEAMTDIRPDIHGVSVENAGLSLLLTASQSANLNPVFALAAVQERFGFTFSNPRYVRRAILTAERAVF